MLYLVDADLGFRLRIIVGILIAFAGGLSVSFARDYSLNGALVLFALVALSLVSATIGEGSWIRDSARWTNEHAEGEEEPPLSRTFAIKVFAILIGAAVIIALIVPRF
jgi:hypothetical protein